MGGRKGGGRPALAWATVTIDRAVCLEVKLLMSVVGGLWAFPSATDTETGYTSRRKLVQSSQSCPNSYRHRRKGMESDTDTDYR
jgi:hypothetical protein